MISNHQYNGVSCTIDPPPVLLLMLSMIGSVSWTKALKSVSFFFDVQKAFDSWSVPHIPLIQKLANINIDPHILKWLQNYLTDRKQFVALEGSSTLQVLSGVPKASVLGPLLFIIYLNDVVHCISNSSKMNLFADDIALYRIIRSVDDYFSLQADIYWCC